MVSRWLILSDIQFMDWIDSARTTHIENFDKAFYEEFDCILSNRIASGNLAGAHISVSKCCSVISIICKGPTQSFSTLLKGSPNAGIDRR